MSQTKIVVIPFKKLLIGAVIAAIIIAFIIFAVIRLGAIVLIIPGILLNLRAAL